MTPSYHRAVLRVVPARATLGARVRVLAGVLRAAPRVRARLAGSVYPPPHYSRCGSFHQAPPPYSEVTSKPDLYPLVITCGDGDGKGGGNYLMVHYFRNYVIRAPGSLSATSTAESLNSSFICNAANEANSIIPPPYSCASNYSDCGVACGRSLLRSLSSLTEPRAAPVLPVTAPAIAAAPARSRTTSDSACARSRAESQAFRDNLITSPVQPLDPSFDLELELIDCEMYCDGGCKPRLGASPPGHRSPGAPEPCPRAAYAPRPPPPAPASPPRPTSPTQSQDSTRRPSDERRPRKKPRKSSLYMPLSVAYPTRTRPSPGARVSSRSAPATPCGALPNLLTFTQRVSASRVGSRSSRFEEESNPLLADIENARTDHKF
ncbi:formin-like protein 13 isoform X3 [Ostrinia furnacalis]|uniref:formin-like protein 13 isoform X3 n=1 Tax=Ostrinia furnacalis TaxID=93504 RepID=UPI00103897E5|nr:formin-like protein 13 isoform X3 [Ostrinia furnacalis]